MNIKSTRAFTLIELLVALAIFAAMAVVVMSTMHSLIISKEQQQLHNSHLRQLQIAQAILQRDLAQVINRPVREDQRLLASFVGYAPNSSVGIEQALGQKLIEFTRLGAANPGAVEQKSTLQRIAYTVREGQLLRLVWQDLDRFSQAKPMSTVLLSNLMKSTIAYQDAAGSQQDTWITGYPGSAVLYENELQSHRQLPVGIDLTLELANSEAFNWYFLLPGGRRAQ